MTGWDWLIVWGAALEASGVVVLAIDIVVAFRRLDRYRERDLVVYQGSPLEVDVASPIEPVVGGKEPTIDVRMEGVETRVTELQEELRNTKARLKEWASESSDAAVGLARKVSDARFTALEGALLGDTRRDKRRRLANVGAVVMGIVLATIGSVAA